jgi:membrane protein
VPEPVPSPPTGRVERAHQLFEKYRNRPLLDLMLRIYERDRESAGSIVGSALAFRLFLFFVPFMLFVVGLSGFLARWTTPGEVGDAAGVTGTLAAQISTALTQPTSTRWLATFSGLFGMAWAGRSLSKVLVSAACLGWRLPVTARAPLRVVGAVLGLIVGIGLVSAFVNRIRLEVGLGAASVSFIAAFAVYAVAWIAVSMLLPRATTDPGALLPGAVVVAGTLAGMQAISQLYLPDKLERASQLYGAIGTTIVTLGWFFFLGRAIVIGTTLDAVIYERFGSISRLVFALPVVRVLPRKSAWIRSFFDLPQ